jgi:lipid A disaccharide synthetase
MDHITRNGTYTVTLQATGQPIVVGYVFDEATRQLARALAAVLAVGLSNGATGELVCGPVSDTGAQDEPQAVVARLAAGQVAQAVDYAAQAQAVRRLYMLAADLIDGKRTVYTLEDVRFAKAELDAISLDIVRAFPVAISNKVGI